MSLSRLRPLDLGDILDGAFAIYRRHFSTLFVTMLIPLLPIAVLWAAFGVVVGVTGAADSENTLPAFNLAMVPVSVILSLIGTAAVTWEVSRAVEGGEVSRSEAYRVAFQRLLPLLGATLLTGVLAMLGLILLIVPGILVMLMMFAVVQTVVIEGKGATEALSRSRALASGAWGKILLALVIATLIIMIPGMITGMVAGGITVFNVIRSGNPEDITRTTVWIPVVTNVLNTVVSSLTTPFFVGVVTLLYYDRRVRTEGLDLAAAAEELPAPV